MFLIEVAPSVSLTVHLKVFLGGSPTTLLELLLDVAFSELQNALLAALSGVVLAVLLLDVLLSVDVGLGLSLVLKFRSQCSSRVSSTCF